MIRPPTGSSSHPSRPPERWRPGKALAAVRAFAWLAALAPFLANRLPLFHRTEGSIRLPALAALHGEDLFWIGLVLLDLARRWIRRPGRWLLGALPVLGGLVLLLPPRPLDPAEVGLRERPMAAGESVLFTPIGFGPDEPDPALLFATGTLLPAPPSSRHWLGSDEHGRDLLARLLFGTRVSLGVGVAATGIALLIGVGVGLLCGTLRGWVDLLLMRVVEVLLCFPHLLFVLVVFAFLPHSRGMLVLLLGLLGWTTTARMTRGELLRLQSEEFVLAARALGVTEARLALRHLLPNALAPLLVAATFGVAGAMLAEFVLSYLGFGVAPPTPSLGQILAEGQRLIVRVPRIALLPGAVMFALVMTFNALGEALRKANDPARRGADA